VAVLVFVPVLVACGGSRSNRAPQQAASSGKTASEPHTRCDTCRPLEVGAHGAFEEGPLPIHGSTGRAPPNGHTVIFRQFYNRQRRDILVSGVLGAYNPTSASVSLTLICGMRHGKHVTHGGVGGFTPERGATIPPHTSLAVPYQFTYANAPRGQDRFELEAFVQGRTLRLVNSSLAIQPLN
jgi:hypothetical protein